MRLGCGPECPLGTVGEGSVGSSRAVTRLWVLAESLAVLVPWLSFVDTSLDNGLLSAAKLHLRKPAQLGG